MRRRRPTRGRRGLRRAPPDGWPLDEVFVGVASCRTIREFFFQERRYGADDLPPRPWDLSLWSGVSPNGSTAAMERLARLGIARVCPPHRPGNAPGFRLEASHPLAEPLGRLFWREWLMSRPRIRCGGGARPPAR